MTVRIGVIGTGAIGADHIRRLVAVLAGAAVTAVTDVDAERAARVAATVPGPAAGRPRFATVRGTGAEVIADDRVDAVLVASSGPAHEEPVLACIAAGKPVFCEKPLAPTARACRRIVEAEVRAGRRLVQVGYMRRYDAAYRALRRVAHDGSIGSPLLLHMAHRNPRVAAIRTSEMAIGESAVHEIDVTRWLLAEEIAAATVLRPRPSSRAVPGLQDPMMIVLETASGVLADVELNINAGYGYDIRAELVGESGTAALAGGGGIVVTREASRRSDVPANWLERFARAYDTELQEWVDAVAAGGPAAGPSSWDGYAAAVVADACIASLHDGRPAAVSLPARPDLYRE
jgi:myo-inositol 2-dehydrogenase / D-chiro-inositol 1-dehydrogenase